MIRVAIIGTGNISAAHIGAYLQFPERCKITALCDIFPEKAQQKAKEYGLEVTVADSHKLLLDRDDIDLVSICTPPYCHGEIAIDFLEHGKNVLVEKPMAASLEECDKMIEARNKSGKLLSVIAQNRFRDPIWNIKEILKSGKIGRVLHAEVDSFWWRGHCYYDLWWRGLWEKEGGGCTLNHAVHHIDMLGWMMGRPRYVQALLSNVAHDNAEVEDLSEALMQYEDGAVAQVTSSVVHHGEEQQVVFQGEKARISAPWKVKADISLDNGFPQENTALEQELENYYRSLPSRPYTAHTGEIDNVLTALETGGKPLVSGEDGRLTIEMITAIYKAGFTHGRVELPLSWEDPYYTVEGIQKNAVHFHEKTTAVKELGTQKTISTGSDYEGEKTAPEKMKCAK